MTVLRQPPHDTAGYDPTKEDPPYSFEQRIEHGSDGRSNVWDVIDATRGKADPVATCKAPADAMKIVDALNRYGSA